MSIQAPCYVASTLVFSLFRLILGLGAVFLDGRIASSSACAAVVPAPEAFFRLRLITSFGGGMDLLEGEGRAVVVPVDPEGGPECETDGGGSCFVFGVAGTEVNGDTVGFWSGAGVADGSRGGSRPCCSCG